MVSMKFTQCFLNALLLTRGITSTGDKLCLAVHMNYEFLKVDDSGRAFFLPLFFTMSERWYQFLDPPVCNWA